MTTTQPVVLRRLSVHAAKLASHQICTGALLPPKVIPRDAVSPTERIRSSSAS